MQHLILKAGAFAIIIGCLSIHFASYPHTAFACTCIPPKPPGEALKQASVVFAGEVSSIKTEKNSAIIEIKVEKVWKGQVIKTIVLETSKWESDCGYSFSIGKRYLIYAGGKEPFTASRCSRTKLLDSALEDLKELGEGKEP
jgi:hypothetical protein